MKKLILLFVLFGTVASIIIVSCKKDLTKILFQDQSVKVIVEKAKQYYSENATLSPSTLKKTLLKTGVSIKSDNTKMPVFYKLAPQWEQFLIVDGSKNTKKLIVPTIENELINKNVYIKRAFVFDFQNESLSNGEIVELASRSPTLNDRFAQIIAHYDDQVIDGFTGAVIRYDMNYFPIKSNDYSNGKKTTLVSRLTNSAQAQTSSQQSVKNSKAITVQEEHHCYELYWCYGNAQPGQSGCEFLGYSESCYDWPTGGVGSDSGYSSGGGGGSGGGPYGGNSGNIVTIDANEAVLCGFYDNVQTGNGRTGSVQNLGFTMHFTSSQGSTSFLVVIPVSCFTIYNSSASNDASFKFVNCYNEAVNEVMSSVKYGGVPPTSLAVSTALVSAIKGQLALLGGSVFSTGPCVGDIPVTTSKWSCTL